MILLLGTLVLAARWTDNGKYLLDCVDELQGELCTTVTGGIYRHECYKTATSTSDSNLQCKMDTGDLVVQVPGSSIVTTGSWQMLHVELKRTWGKQKTPCAVGDKCWIKYKRTSGNKNTHVVPVGVIGGRAACKARDKIPAWVAAKYMCETGWPTTQIYRGLCTMEHESGFNPTTLAAWGGTRSIDLGIIQVNTNFEACKPCAEGAGQKSESESRCGMLCSEVYNSTKQTLTCAKKIWESGGWGRWYGYKAGACSSKSTAAYPCKLCEPYAGEGVTDVKGRCLRESECAEGEWIGSGEGATGCETEAGNVKCCAWKRERPPTVLGTYRTAVAGDASDGESEEAALSTTTIVGVAVAGGALLLCAAIACVVVAVALRSSARRKAHRHALERRVSGRESFTSTRSHSNSLATSGRASRRMTRTNTRGFLQKGHSRAAMTVTTEELTTTHSPRPSATFV